MSTGTITPTLTVAVTLDDAARAAGIEAPFYAQPGDAGADLRTTEHVILPPGQRKLVHTGLSIALPEGYAAFIHPRSGLAAKHGLTVVNAPGTVDAGYRGEIMVCLLNTDQEQSIELGVGDRIAQLVIQRVEAAAFQIVDALPESVRGTGGFGSTGGFTAPAKDAPVESDPYFGKLPVPAKASRLAAAVNRREEIGARTFEAIRHAFILAMTTHALREDTDNRSEFPTERERLLHVARDWVRLVSPRSSILEGTLTSVEAIQTTLQTPEAGVSFKAISDALVANAGVLDTAANRIQDMLFNPPLADAVFRDAGAGNWPEVERAAA